VAQPPLYRVVEGKQERYLKDEDEFNEFVLRRVSAKGCVSLKNGRQIRGAQLIPLVSSLLRFYDSVERLVRRGFSRTFLESLARFGLDDRRKFKNREFMDQLLEELQDQGFEISDISVREEDGYYQFRVSNGPGVTHEFVVDWEFISCPELRHIIAVSATYRDLTRHPFVVSFDGEEKTLQDPEDLVAMLLDRGKKGLTIQRYKGLGEMNPEQLWATTMDPNRRNLLQVTIEDAVEADEIFTILMGDKVEPRRAFIQNNALEVRELDI